MRTIHEIPELYSNTRERDPLALVRFHASWLKTSWYVFEWDGKDTFFGYQKKEGEVRQYGLFSLSQLAALKSEYGAPVLQDYAFQPTRMSELRRKERPIHLIRGPER
jgi:hypothetical protein